MTKQEYLGQVRQLDRRIDGLLSELAALRAMSMKVTSAIGNMPGSQGWNGSKLESAVLKIIEQEKAIDDAVDAYVEKRREVIAALGKMRNARHADILRLRYLDGRTWDEVAGELRLCARRVYALHKEALDEFQIPDSASSASGV